MSMAEESLNILTPHCGKGYMFMIRSKDPEKILAFNQFFDNMLKDDQIRRNLVPMWKTYGAGEYSQDYAIMEFFGYETDEQKDCMKNLFAQASDALGMTISGEVE